jgi:N-acyl-D-amino-acid deacylase
VVTLSGAGQIDDFATFEDPRVPPAGIIHVAVNGKMAVMEGNPTGALAGKAIP